jgi:hypothetical protein
LLPKKKAAGRWKKSVTNMNAKTKSTVNTAVSRNSTKNCDCSRNVDSTHDKPWKRAERGSKRTSKDIEQTATAVVSAKRSQMQSSADQQHHDADELNSIENCTVLILAFSNALDREKENAVLEQIIESFSSNAAGRATLQRMHNSDASGNTAMGICPPPSHTAMEALFSNENPGRRHGGRLEASVMDLDDVQAELRGLTRKESMEKRQPYVADRVWHYVNSVIINALNLLRAIR